MFPIILWFTSLLIADSFQLKGEKKYLNLPIKNKMKLSMTTDIQDLNTIYSSKDYFLKDSYNDVIKNIMDEKIDKIFVSEKSNQAIEVFKDDILNSNIFHHYHMVTINKVILPNLLDKALEKNVYISFVDFTPPLISWFQGLASNLGQFLQIAFPIYIAIIIISGIVNLSNSGNSMGGNKKGGNNLNMFGGVSNMDNKIIDKNSLTNISLKEWIGNPEVMEEVRDVISYLSKKEEYKKIGAEMPKGILLEGPPGTGKTLLAKAIAYETNSAFFSISGSEFVEVFVGVGASKVRKLFESARENAPSIIFIDEIDAIGKQRGNSASSSNGANDEREQTLNQILYEMDGFNNNDNIIVMGATNRKDILDQALLRPGRFDRIIRIPLPDKDSREKIIEFYLNNKKKEMHIDMNGIADLTSGFSGAQLKNLINEAAILSVRNNYTMIKENYIYDSFEKTVVGLLRNNLKTDNETINRVTIHEIGHALLVLKFKEYFDFKKVSIQSTYNGAGGYTLFTEKPEIKNEGLYTKDILKKRLIIAMGGKAAESIYYGDEFVSLGATQDLNQANKLAKQMICNYGMGEKLNVFYKDQEENVFSGNSYSEETKTLIDNESLDLVREAYKEAKNILSNNTEYFQFLCNLLKNQTTISSKELPYLYLF